MPSGTVSSQPDANTAAAVDDPQIELIGVRKVFGDVVAVEGADLTVGDGELFAILGPSGSGKTTVLRMVAGFEQPTAGVIKLGGVDVTALPARHRDVNTVFQEYALFPHMTVAQNVEYGLKVKGVPKAERRRRTADALDMVRLTDHAPRRPAQLSGGQRQRVALARALVGRPRVLLLDEPLGALDLKLREQMQIELKAIQREVGITFVIVTHDQDEALTLCDRLAVFNDGRIEQVGNARDVYENPANRFVADFVGTSNVLDGAAAEALMGRPGMFVIRPERIGVFRPGTDPVPGVRTVDATVSEVIYAGPTTRIAATAPPGVTLTATVLTAKHVAAARPAPRNADHVGLARKGRPPIEIRGVAMTSTPVRIGLALVACAALVLPFSTACSKSEQSGGGNGQSPPKMEPLSAVGNGEGQLNLIAWAGYAENGSNDKSVDWVTPFEQQTGCKVNVKIGNTSDEMVQLMRSGQYDGVSASGDATLRLIYAGDVAPVNTDLVPNYASISSFLKDKSWNSVNGQMYGIPHGWGANLLMYNIDVVRDAPNSWGAVFDDAGKYKGKVTAYDSPIYIADAALYLSKTKPDLGIKDPYSLTSEQLDAAVELLKKQRENVSEYWSDYTKEVQAFESGTSVIGTTWQVIANTIGTDNKVQVNTVLPKEGPQAGRTPGCSRRRPPIRIACTSGWTGSPHRR